MNEETKMKWLKTFLRVYGVLTLLIFSSLSVGFLIQTSLMNSGGVLHWLIWDEITGHVGPMLFVIYLVWGAFFFPAANNPFKFRSFLDFTMWANLAHGLLMVPMALMDGSYSSKFLTDIPFILILAIGLAFLRPRVSEVQRVALDA
ncbi:MAG: hypothetical protein J2P36_22700 [Ktedonobacteraceae bacterium]|nr:hypothetical protein [Ktedonobacteraceae bacterium]